MANIKAALLIASAFIMTACASGAQRQAGPTQGSKGKGPGAGIDQAERLLATGRQIRAEKGCAAAAPTYRVIASFGEGYEVAQYELGACLLEIEGESARETALFREEGLFWLRRAAYADNARAQWRLANTLSGAPAAVSHGPAPEPGKALGWALVYKENAAHELYGLAPVNPNVLAHLHASLPDDAIARAEAFAAKFKPISMAVFSPPPRENANSGPRRTQGDFSERRPRRR